MVSTVTFHDARRSTRVPLKVVIAIEGGAESRTCEGETIVVNLHGALIATAIGLSRGMRISIRVYLTHKRAAARVVYIDPENPLHCGVELVEPRNIGEYRCHRMTGKRQGLLRSGLKEGGAVMILGSNSYAPRKDRYSGNC
jgi:hypothetical protein